MSYANVYFARKKTGDTIYLYEYDKNGQRQLREEEYESYCYIPSDDGDYKDLFGNRCKKKVFDSYYGDQRPYVKDKTTYEGDIPPEDRFLIDNYHDKNLLETIPKLQVHTIDIETDSCGGMSTASRIEDEILLITVYSNVTKKYHVFGVKDYTPEADNVEYNYCEDERELLKKYFKWHTQNFPDVITGWNSKWFDIPYILDRTLHYSENMHKRYSPFKNVRELNFGNKGFNDREYDIAGITQLDYLDLYKEFSINESESYKLNHITHLELGEEKLKFDGTLFDLWKTDWKKYVDYNIKDVELVKKLDDKLAFIDLIQVQAYICKVPLKKVSSSIKKFDNYLMTTLKSRKIVLPTLKRKSKQDFIGGYVAKPQRGFYAHITSFDFRALYPHIIFALNLSPETFVGVILDDIGQPFRELDMGKIWDDNEYIIVDRKKNEKTVNGLKLKKWIRKKKYMLSPNGLMFKSEEGFLPKVVQGVFSKRKEYKKIMQQHKMQYEKTQSQEDADLAHKYDLYQYAMKIFANSIYGIMGNANFRFFNPDFAEAITLTGRKVIIYSSDKTNELFKEKFDLDYDAVVYGDTDSIYVNYLPVVEKFGLEKDTLISGINTFNEETMQPFFDEIFDEFSMNLMNTGKNWFELERESISTGAIFIEPKKYCCRVIDEEYTTFAEPKLKVKGMEIVRSSTPAFCREKIKEVVNLIIDTMDRQKVIDDIRDIRLDFYKQDIEDIAFPRGVKTIDKYLGSRGNILSGCTIQARASINFNNLLNRFEVNGKYTEIHQGDKIKFIYMKESNTVLTGQNIIGFSEVLPEEFGLHKFIDKDTQFEKSFMGPIKKLFDAVGFGYPNIDVTNMEEFF
jgi:DNA polymerase elongation subunit (family B)